jgi:hypothetical protein
VKTLPMLLVGGALGLAAIAACGSPEPLSSPALPSVSPSPPRPREVSLADADPCTLVTPELRAQLQNLNDHFSRHKPDDPLVSRDCTATNVPDVPSYALSIRLVTNEGIAEEKSARSTPTTVGGFGALEQPGLLGTSPDTGCLIMVDAAANQAVWVAFGTADGTPAPGGYPAMCVKAHVAAESVMRELLARTP